MILETLRRLLESLGEVLLYVAGAALAVVLVALVISLPAAWITHVIVTITAITSGGFHSLGYSVLLIVGVFFPPVGVVHGYGIWFGVW